jgi:hypothetical protein
VLTVAKLPSYPYISSKYTATCHCIYKTCFVRLLILRPRHQRMLLLDFNNPVMTARPTPKPRTLSYGHRSQSCSERYKGTKSHKFQWCTVQCTVWMWSSSSHNLSYIVYVYGYSSYTKMDNLKLALNCHHNNRKITPNNQNQLIIALNIAQILKLVLKSGRSLPSFLNCCPLCLIFLCVPFPFCAGCVHFCASVQASRL